MITLNSTDVARAALARHAAGTLSAQAPNPMCRYRVEQGGVVYACAVGAGLTDAQVAELTGLNDGIWQGATVKAVKGVTADSMVSELQWNHDQWAGAPADKRGSREAGFLKLARTLAGGGRRLTLKL